MPMMPMPLSWAGKMEAGVSGCQEFPATGGKLAPFFIEVCVDRNTPMYRRIFTAVVWEDGNPLNYEPRAQIVIEPPPPDSSSTSAQPQNLDYHWGREGEPVKISFTYDPHSGVGLLWYYDKTLERLTHGNVNTILHSLITPISGELNRRNDSGFTERRRLGLWAEEDDSFKPDSRKLRALFEPRHAN